MSAKEVQKTIEERKNLTVGDEEFYSVLKTLSPGTSLRTGLDGILKYGKGALIVVKNEFLPPIMDGGFKVDSKFTSQRLIELSKMDGAIILSSDMKRILFANVLLSPDTKIKTSETGTRHKAAERTAKQIGGLTIAISEKRGDVTIFYKNRSHKLKEISEIVRKVNEYLQILEKQKDLFNMNIELLNRLELKNYIHLNHAVETIQRGKIIQQISKDISKFFIELGSEGRMFKIRLKEILFGVEKETNLVIRDYAKVNYKKAISVLDKLSYEELLEKERVLKALDYENPNEVISVSGWRMLSKTFLDESEIAELIKESNGLRNILSWDVASKKGALSDDKFSMLRVELEKLKMGI